MKTYQPFPRGPVYSDLNIGEAVEWRSKNGAFHPVRLLEIGYQGPAGKPGRAELGWVTVQVNETPVSVPLGWWRSVDGVRIVAELNRVYNCEPGRKELEGQLFRLEHDARIFLSDALHPVIAKGQYAFPLAGEGWGWDAYSNWLTKYNGGSMTHAGVDLHCPAGVATVRAAMGGEVVYVGGYKGEDEQGSAGLVVAIIGDDNIGYLYAHMRKLAKGIHEGARVEAGTLLGPAGQSGFEKVKIVPHIHFEMVVGESSEALRLALRPPFADASGGTKALRINPYPYLCQWFEEQVARENSGGGDLTAEVAHGFFGTDQQAHQPFNRGMGSALRRINAIHRLQLQLFTFPA